MSRKTLINILENTFQPSLNQAMVKDILGSEGKVIALAAQTTLAIKFNEHAYQDITLGSAGVTVTAVTTGMKDGEVIILKIIQDGTAARAVVFSTGFTNPLGLVVTPLIDAVDYYLGIVDGGSITLLNLTPNTDVGILAALGSDQAGAALIVTSEVLVTGTDDAKGVRLPPVTPDKIIVIHTTVSDKDLKIYPATGEKINGGTANANVLFVCAASDTATARLFKKADGDWYCLVIRGTLT